MSMTSIQGNGKLFDFTQLITSASRTQRSATFSFSTASSGGSSGLVGLNMDLFVRRDAKLSLQNTVHKVQNAFNTPSGKEPVYLRSGGIVDVEAGVVIRHASEVDAENLSTLPPNTIVEQSSDDPQVAANLAQAKEITSQLNLGNGATWGMDSVARDLAVFGLDFTAFDQDPDSLVETIRTKSLEALDKLDTTAADYDSRRNTITGASARLVNGVKSGGGQLAMANSSMSASWSINSVVSGLASANSGSNRNTVTIGGKQLDASFIIGVGNVIVDPLVLDLAGDGIDLKGAEDGVEFDMNGDGTKANMGFIKGDDALLFMDTHGDGLVHDGSQLFGNQDGHANGFEMLQSYDSNGDGVIDENDEVWDKLRVWVEKTADGVCEEGETMSLKEAGITSINVGYKDVREDDGKGNLIGQVGQFTRDDGSTGLAADAWFQTAPKSEPGSSI